MLTTKRVLIATICGFIFGLVCMLLASSNPNSAEQISTATKWTIIFSRTLMGFTIGVSAIRLQWWLHGIVIGFIGSIPMIFHVMDRPAIVVGTLVMGMIYGFLTELITSILFKEKSAGMQKATA
ncbi:MAG: hypothetical protein N3A61_02155 [Ignavibacteria bacterium]|nr:hypothetical protein [Ignavibacteria bacterium]